MSTVSGSTPGPAADRGPSDPLDRVRHAGVETTGIEIIDESARTAKPSDLFWPWFAANISVFGITYAAFVLGFGVSFWQGVLVAVFGITLSFFFCGVIAIAGKRGSAPTMILSRAPFGVTGQKVPGVISWLVSIGWETFLAILATLATVTVFQELGWAHGTAVKVIAMIVVASLIVAASVAGYHIIMRMQSVLTWITGIVTILFIALTVNKIDWSAATAAPDADFKYVIGALVMVMTGFGLGWINIAADWSRYQRRDASASAIVGWNTFAGAIAPVVLVIYGLALAGSGLTVNVADAGEMPIGDAIGVNPIGTLAYLLPDWFLVPFLIAVILSLVSGAVLGIYSSGLTLLSLGVRIPRPAAAAIDGLILTAGTIFVVFFATSFIDPFQSFLITLGVPLAAWAGVMMADIVLRKRDYDEAALFDSRGRYGAWNWTSVGLMVLGSLIGWGLVINNFAESASWNNWQGYLLGPLGLGGKEGDWAWANLGVLAALVIGFVGYLALNSRVVRRQEEGSYDVR